MNDVLSIVLIVLALLIGGYAALRALRGLGMDDPLLFALAGLEVLLVIQLIGGIVAVAGTSRDVAAATFVGYLIACVLLPPLATGWALFEKSRWGPAVIVVLGISIAVMVVRAQQIWAVPVG